MQTTPDCMISRYAAHLLVAAFSLALLLASPAYGQQDDALDQKTVDAFASAMVKVDEIRMVYTPQIENASTPEAANALQAEANELMIQAISGEGLDVPTYNAISQAMQQDDALRERVMKRVQAIQG